MRSGDVNFFKHRARFPRFKSTRGTQSSYHRSGRTCSRRGPDRLTGKYFAACLFEDGKDAPESRCPPAEAVVGVN
jgi:hypothetical protein